jgi:hypothetical protein
MNKKISTFLIKEVIIKYFIKTLFNFVDIPMKCHMDLLKAGHP